MKLSVVTVCFNCKKDIKITLKSVKRQTSHNFEYIIIDGASTDGTLKVIEEYEKQIPNMAVYSEKDKGIYDAMNKGVGKASGDYIIFLNAGDTFAKENVISTVEKYFTSNKDIYYGKAKKGDYIESYPEKLDKKYLVLREKMLCHQAIFAKRDCLIKFPFDVSLRICADRDWLLRALDGGCTTYYMRGVVVCDYDCNGISTNYEKYSQDSLLIAKRYGRSFAIVFVKTKRIIGRLIGHR